MQIFKYQRSHGKKETLLCFVTSRFKYQKEDAWQRAIESGKLQVNNKTVPIDYILHSNDQIIYHRKQEEEPAIDPSYRILYEEEKFLVVEKNPSIPVSPSGMYFYNTLIHTIKTKEGYPSLHAVHRLDRETSGVLVIAKDQETARLFGKQFFEAKPKKVYYAILQGTLTKSILIDQPIGKANEEATSVRIRQTVTPQGKSSQTKFIPKKSDNNVTLVEIIPYTGRTHQIRCHANFIGHPILGDKLYGQKDEDFIALLKGTKPPVFPPYGEIKHHLLHAYSISFSHPYTKETLSFETTYKHFWQAIPYFANSDLLE